MAPSAFEVAFLSTAHTPADLDKVGESFDAALTTLGAGGGGR
jgi:glutamate-1-semialdehyde aminotransferase